MRDIKARGFIRHPIPLREVMHSSLKMNPYTNCRVKSPKKRL